MAYYENYKIEEFEKPPVSVSASTEKKNLIAGVPPYGVLSHGPIHEDYHTEYYNTKEGLARLTDGTIASVAKCGDPAYVHFTGGIGRTIVFKLGGLSAVSGVRVAFLREDSTGVRLPRRCNVLLSDNGVTWQKLVDAYAVRSVKSDIRVIMSVDFEKPVKAVYVMFEFDTQCHIWIDDIEVIGTEAITDDAVAIVPDEKNSTFAPMSVNKYPEYSDFLGIHNLLLAYNCVPPEKIGDHELGYTTVEQYLPYVGYHDANGNIVDTFFDAFMYLPYSVYTYSYLYKCAEGWNYYVDNVFAKDRNLDALNQAAAIVGDKLGIKDYKVKVFFSILCSKVHYGAFPEKFGDLDGDGIDEDMDTLEDRKKALKWIIDVQVEKYRNGSYPHTELGGFYWFEEDINYSDAFELDLIAYSRDYLHSLGLIFYWIPYYTASGYQDWKENGFDIACMQPNYAFNKSINVQRLYDNAETAKLLGLCVEMEMGGNSPYDIEKFKCYMDAGAETGYMNTVKMYYQGGCPGCFYDACKSEDPLLRSVYDDLYLYAKEKYVSRKNRG